MPGALRPRAFAEHEDGVRERLEQAFEGRHDGVHAFDPFVAGNHADDRPSVGNPPPRADRRDSLGRRRPEVVEIEPVGNQSCLVLRHAVGVHQRQTSLVAGRDDVRRGRVVQPVEELSPRFAVVLRVRSGVVTRVHANPYARQTCGHQPDQAGIHEVRVDDVDSSIEAEASKTRDDERQVMLPAVPQMLGLRAIAPQAFEKGRRRRAQDHERRVEMRLLVLAIQVLKNGPSYRLRDDVEDPQSAHGGHRSRASPRGRQPCGHQESLCACPQTPLRACGPGAEQTRRSAPSRRPLATRKK